MLIKKVICKIFVSTIVNIYDQQTLFIYIKYLLDTKLIVIINKRINFCFFISIT